MRTLTRLAIALLLLVAVAVPAVARKAKADPTAPGVYVDWKDEVDEFEIVESFKLSDYETVSVEPFDTEDTPLPDADDNTYGPVKSVLADAAGPFTQGLAGAVGDRIDVSRGAVGGAKAIVLRARVESMDPGSRAARYGLDSAPERPAPGWPARRWMPRPARCCSASTRSGAPASAPRAAATSSC